MALHSHKNHKYETHFIAPAAALAIVVAFSVWGFSKPTPEADFVNDPVFSRELVAYEILPTGEEAESLVKYEYLGEPLPEKLAPDEDVTKRTETSYHRVVQPGTEDTPATYQGIFYSQPTFAREGDEWRYIEHATTTKAAFDALRAESPLATLFLRKAQAQSISPFSGAGDGYIDSYSSELSDGCSLPLIWANARAGSPGSADPTGSTGVVGASTNYSNEPSPDPDLCEANVYRTFLPFVTSAIPAAATISTASLSVYVTSKINDDNDGTDYITVVRTSQFSAITLDVGDFGSIGSTEGVATGDRKDITSISTSAYLTFTLNATGRSWIAKSGTASNCGVGTGTTCLGLREGHDLADDQVVFTSSINISSSEATGTSQDPYLSVTYSGGGNAFWMWSDF